MTRPIKFEDFGAAPPPLEDDIQPTVDVAAIEREAYDQGYKTGWDDGVEATQTDEGKAHEDLKTALQEMGFTYQEARQHVMKSLRPLLLAMSEQVLPLMVQASFAQKIVDQVEELAKEIEPPFTIRCSPANSGTLIALLENYPALPMKVEPEETLLDGQATLFLDEGQTQIDLTQTLEAIATAIAEFYDGPAEELSNVG